MIPTVEGTVTLAEYQAALEAARAEILALTTALERASDENDELRSEVRYLQDKLGYCDF